MEKSGRGKRRSFSDEYKAEAVRLVGKSGKSIGAIARELGLGETALRRWVQQAEIDAGRGPTGALTTSEREELARLRRDNQRLRMEREIPKKRRPSSPRRACEIRFHRSGEGLFPGDADVPGAGSLAGRVLCLAPAADGGADPPGSDLGGCGRLDIRREPRTLRQSAGADGTARSGPAERTQADRPADARAGVAGPSQAPLSDHHRLPPWPAGMPHPAGAALRRGPAQHRVGDRHDLPLDRARLALPGGDYRPVLAPDSGLVDERTDRS